MWIWLSVLGLAYTIFQVLQAYQLGEGEFAMKSLLLLACLSGRAMGGIGQSGLVAGA